MKVYRGYIVLLTTVLICRSIAMAQEKTVTYYADPASVPPDLSITLVHLKAEVNFIPEENRVFGKAEFTFVPNRYQTDSMVFSCPDFKIASVMLGGKPVFYRKSAHNLIIYPISATADNSKSGTPCSLEKGRSYKLLVCYEARPMAGAIYFVGWRPDEKGKRKSIWAHRPHGWIPYMDARILMDLYITFDKKFAVFSNGDRLETVENPDGTNTWHYAMKKNHPFFSTCLVIGDYQYKASKTTRGVPLEYWYYSDVPEKVAPTYKYTEAMFDFFEKEMGVNYPYTVYRQAPVMDYMYGGMETTTATVFGDFMLIDPRAWWQRNYVNVNAHELAHQWFGNYVAHLVNEDVWLTESFGTYYAKMFEKSIYGEDQYQNVRNEEMQLTFEAAKRNNFPVGGTQGGVERIYRKGSLVLDMLRDVMGEKEFHDAIKLYLERYGFRYAETNDLLRCIYDVTGKPYNWFFDEWVYRGGEPHFKVSYAVLQDTLYQRFTRVKIEQIHETNDLIGIFRMPVNIEVHYKDGSFDSTITLTDSKSNEVMIPNREKKPIAFVLFDPGRRVLKKLTFDRSFDELSAQVMQARNMIDRLDALILIRNYPFIKKQPLLADAFRKETFFLIKSEIIDQMIGDRSPETVELFREALKDKDANIRKSALKNLHPVPDLLRTSVEEMLRDSSYLNVEMALENLCSSFPLNVNEYLDLTKTMEGWRGKNIRMKWLEISISGGHKEYLHELIGYTAPRYEFETRMNAFSLLKKLLYFDNESIANARQASKHWNNKLSAAGRDYLGYFGK